MATPSPTKKSPTKIIESKAMSERRALNKRLVELSPRKHFISSDDEGPAYAPEELATPEDVNLFKEAQKRLAADNVILITFISEK